MTAPRAPCFGAVLAGGQSRRMGADKAALAIDGVPLWRRQLRVLRDAGVSDPVLVRGPGQPAPEGVRILRDLHPGIGPMGGLHAALAAAGDAPLALLAVDMPGIGPDWFAWLLGHCGDGTGAMARHALGCEPLAAVYPPSALPLVDEAVSRGDYSLQRLAVALAGSGRMRLVDLGPAEVDRVRSVNTPLDSGAWGAVGPPGAGL